MSLKRHGIIKKRERFEPKKVFTIIKIKILHISEFQMRNLEILRCIITLEQKCMFGCLSQHEEAYKSTLFRYHFNYSV